ncbi:E3 ubiquitin-protein ligase MARCHF6-like [Apostichopus japonicus]|uniref:E3 ubiquitin-protein ligase MARCHF6-like n=1 Tax=Stichopus japonicus TaxID=307972 RepID=UPI003AB6EBC3
MGDESTEGDICRVCRAEGSHDRPLFHPCICTGSIRYIHQECLVQWLKHSKKEYCELCMHRFTFTPIYSPDMPSHLPVRDIILGLTKNIGKAIKCWLHYTLVTFAWLGVVPITASRIYRCLFHTSFRPFMDLTYEILSVEKMAVDIVQGCLVVACTLCAFISLVWLREQVTHGGGPDWLNLPPQQNEAQAQPQAAEPQQPQGDQNQEEGDGGQEAPADEAPGQQAQPRVAENNGGGEEDPIAIILGQADNAVNNEEAAENNGNQDDINWNALEWDRAAEELTWERMLGLDGSLVFLEHVFWVMSLNALFIFLFAFCPYHVGKFGTVALGLQDAFQESHFHGLLTTMLGYTALAVTLLVFHYIFKFFSCLQASRILGMSFIVLKVFLLLIQDIGVTPLVCGWWIDICSLSLFNISLWDRIRSFHNAPGTAMFLHWLVGMAFVFYFASFIILLREVLRPGVLWFLRNFNDPDFNPVQDMIHIPVYRHARRFLMSVIVFGTVVLLVLWLPIQLIQKIFAGFLPYFINPYSDAPVSELSLELLLLQVILPALLEQGHTRQWLKNLIKYWALFASWLLNLHSYLLGDVTNEGERQREAVEDGQEDAAGEGGEEQQQEDEINPPEAGREPGLEEEEEEELGAVGGAEQPEVETLYDQSTQTSEDMLRQRVHSTSSSSSDLALHQVRQEDAASTSDASYGTRPRSLSDDSDVEMEEELEEEEAGSMSETDLSEDDEAGGGDEDAAEVINAMDRVDEGGGAIPRDNDIFHGAALLGFKPYTRPNMFHFRISLLLVLVACSTVLASFVCLTLPVFLGRRMFCLVLGEDTTNHELYTGACGLYLCWLMLRLSVVVGGWVPHGIDLVLSKFREYLLLVGKALLVAVLLLGVIPILLGLLFEVIVVIPLRVDLNQTPVVFLKQDWALGVLHTKILCAVTMMGPSWWLKDALEQVYQDGIRNLNLSAIIRGLALPVISCLLLALALPYTFARGIFPLFRLGDDWNHIMIRRIYPSLISVISAAAIMVFQVRQFKRLYEHIKNDKYLVGQQLVNYEPKRQQQIAEGNTER